jgi:RimJ/RimL family protein N-acetyltransferase
MTTLTITNPILIDIPMPIETDRLIIRPPMAGDGAAVTAAKAETPDLIRWMPWAKNAPDPAADEAVMRKASADFITRTDLMMIAFERASGVPVVFTGLHRIDWHARVFEIGYWARTSARSKGYVTETANALTRFAFNALAARKVIITHADGNDASAAVIRRLGYPLEVVERYGTTLPDGAVVDQHRYARFDTNGLPHLDVRW